MTPDEARQIVEALATLYENAAEIERDRMQAKQGAALRALLALAEDGERTMSRIDTMVSRFLSWPLPKTFAPDCGISFDGRKDDEWNKNKTWPIGTNLFTADEARAMILHLLAAPATEPRPSEARSCTCSWAWPDGRDPMCAVHAASPDAPAEGREPDDYPYETDRDDYGSL